MVPIVELVQVVVGFTVKAVAPPQSLFTGGQVAVTVKTTVFDVTEQGAALLTIT